MVTLSIAYGESELHDRAITWITELWHLSRQAKIRRSDQLNYLNSQSIKWEADYQT